MSTYEPRATNIAEDPDELHAEYAALRARIDAGAPVSAAELAEMSERLSICAEDQQRTARALRTEFRERYGVTPL